MKITIPERNNTPGTRLYLKTYTKGKLGEREVILLIPGGPGGNHTVFDSIKDQLLEYADLILFDPRGCGFSDPSEARYCALDNYVEDIESIRSILNLDKITLLGGSYGGIAAIGYAVKYGNHLNQLVLVSTAASSEFLDTAKKNLCLRGSEDQIKAADDLWNGTFRDANHFTQYYKIMSDLYMYKKSIDQVISPPTIKKNIPYNYSVTNLGYSNFLKYFNYKSQLKNIACKTLILSGREDWIMDPIYSKEIAELIPNSQLIIFEQCGHFIWEDQREQFFAALNGFLIQSDKQESTLTINR